MSIESTNTSLNQSLNKILSLQTNRSSSNTPEMKTRGHLVRHDALVVPGFLFQSHLNHVMWHCVDKFNSIL